jgi:hypothetical protein
MTRCPMCVFRDYVYVYYYSFPDYSLVKKIYSMISSSVEFVVDNALCSLLKSIKTGMFGSKWKMVLEKLLMILRISMY